MTKTLIQTKMVTTKCVKVIEVIKNSMILEHVNSSQPLICYDKCVDFGS